jgi:hypothetical protein
MCLQVRRMGRSYNFGQGRKSFYEILASGSLLISSVIARYIQSDRSHIVLRICSEACGSSSDVVQSMISGSMLLPLANRFGIVGARQTGSQVSGTCLNPSHLIKLTRQTSHRYGTSKQVGLESLDLIQSSRRTILARPAA